MAGKIEARLKELGLELPAPGAPGGNYIPFVQVGELVFVAGQVTRLDGKLHFVGFDASDKLVAGVESGGIEGLVLQDPFNMGYLAVKTMVQHLKGEKVERRIDTGSKLITKANMNEPEMKRLLKPELDQWLKE